MSSSAEAGGMSAGLFPARTSGREGALTQKALLRDNAVRDERVHRARRRGSTSPPPRLTAAATEARPTTTEE